VFILFSLAACRPSPEEAGLTGENPVVLISVISLCGDCDYGDEVSISRSGEVEFSAVESSGPKFQRQKMLDPQVFRDVAIDVAPYRPQSGVPVKEAKNCLKDMALPTVIWRYANGRAASNEVGSTCEEDRVKDEGKLVRLIAERLSIQEWRREAFRGGESR